MEDTSREMEENKGVVDEVQWWLEGVFLPFLQLLGLAGERSCQVASDDGKIAQFW